MHTSLQSKRHNKNREFFRTSIDEVIEKIKMNADEIIDEEFNKLYFKASNEKSLECYRKEFAEISNWTDVDNLYYKVQAGEPPISSSKKEYSVWQMISNHSSKKMQDIQSVISHAKYNIDSKSMLVMYTCSFSLPMGRGETTKEEIKKNSQPTLIVKNSPYFSILQHIIDFAQKK